MTQQLTVTGDTADVAVVPLAEHQTYGGRRWLWIAFVAAALLYAAPAIWLLRNYMQPAFDLAIYDQTLWLIAHGETFNTIIASHIFGVHFSPILLALSPISYLPGGAAPELALQGLLLASGVFPAAFLADQLDKPRSWLVAAYLMHPAIIGGSWYGFRPWNLAVPVLTWAIYWVVRNPTGRRIVVAGLVLLAFREDLAVWVGLVAIVLALARRVRWRDLIVPGIVLGGATGIVLLGVLPELSPVDSYFFATSAETTVPTLAVSASSLIVRVLFLVAPFAVLPSGIEWKLAAPLALPILGLLFKGGNALSTSFHYDMMFVPILLLVVALSSRAVATWKTVAAVSVLVLLLFGVLRPFPPQHGPNPWRYDAEVTATVDHTLAVLREIEGIERLSVSAPSHVVPHLSERENIFIYPEPISRSQNVEDDQYAGALDFACPQPNVVVTIGQENESWSAILEESYEPLDQGALSVWKRRVETTNDPCRAEWRPHG